jgi:hypothetical protein
MNKIKRRTLLIILSFAFALICIAQAQVPAENMKTFYDSELPGIGIQVDATAETRPSENVTVMLSLKTQTEVHVQYLNLSMFGFINGTDKVLMANITDNDFSLSNGAKGYNCTFPVPEEVWGIVYGEMVLTYSAKYGLVTLDIEKLICGFTMTDVENIYLENLASTYDQLNQTFCDSFNMSLSPENLAQLNQTYWEYQQNYSSTQGTLNELNSTRQAAIALGITTVFFVSTTAYLVMRKPRQSW